jgi:hypothetical protein
MQKTANPISANEDLERYFHQTRRADVLKPGMSATACCNIRTALSWLGYRREWQRTDRYDKELESVVRQFQKTKGHPNADGWVGPGTRKLLVIELKKIDFDFQRLLEIFEYDVALSFAGEDRDNVDALAKLLSKKEILVFYDAYERSNLWGKNLLDHLEEIYSRRARFCVMFASSAYAEKVWPTHERRWAQERALNQASNEYILPIRIDGTKIPGLPSTVAYIRIEEGIEHIGELLLQKIRKDREKNVSVRPKAHSGK